MRQRNEVLTFIKDHTLKKFFVRRGALAAAG